MDDIREMDSMEYNISLAEECVNAFKTNDETKMLTSEEHPYVRRQCDGTHSTTARGLG